MLQPRKGKLDLSGAKKILESERKPLDLSSAESILKKKEFSGEKAENTESEMPIGSSDSQGFEQFDAFGGKTPVEAIVSQSTAPSKDLIRVDGTIKGDGFMGRLKMKDGSSDYATEKSIGVNINGKEVLIPSIVPTLDKSEVDFILSGGNTLDKNNPIANKIVSKAIDFAKDRENKGLPFFATPKEQNKTISLDDLKKGISNSLKPRGVVNPSKEAQATMQKVQENELATNNFRNMVKEKLGAYREATQLDDTNHEEARTELDDVKKEKGFWNTTKSLLGQTKNFFTSGGFLGQRDNPLQEQENQAKQEFKEKGVTPTKEQLSKRADELFVEQKLDNAKQQKVNDYLNELDPDTKRYLEVDASERYNTLSQKTKEVTDRIALNSKYGNQIADELDNPNLPTEDRQMLEEELLRISKDIEKDHNTFATDTKELGSTEDELDAFKRNYGAIDNFTQRAITSIGNAGIDIAQGLNYIQQGKPGADALEAKLLEAKSGIEAYKEKFRPDNKELTKDNFLQYSTDMLGDMSGLMLEMSTGNPTGLLLVGTGGAGRKFGEMKKEELTTGKEFSPEQMAVAPLVSGSSEALLFALPVGKALQGTKRVWMSLGENEFNGAVKKASQSLKDRIFTDAEHIVTADVQMSLNNIVQNAINKDILGKDDVGYFDNAWKVLTDATVLTGMIRGAGTLPHVAMAGAKMFTPAEKVNTLDTNGKKIITLSKQLDDPTLDSTTKTAIENAIAQTTKESSGIVSESIEKMSKMSEEEVKSVLNDTKKVEQIKKSAEQIKTDESKTNVAKKVILNALKQEYQETNKSIQSKLNEPAKENNNIDSNSKVFVHETNSDAFDKFSNEHIGSGQGDSWLGKGVYLQEKEGFKLESYGKNKIEATLKEGAKIFEVKDTPNGEYRDNFVEWAVNNGLAKDIVRERKSEGLSPKNILPRDIFKRNSQNVVDKLKEEGFSGLNQDGELVVYDPESLEIRKNKIETEKSEKGNKVTNNSVDLQNGKETEISERNTQAEIGSINESDSRIQEIGNRLGKRSSETESQLERPLTNHESEDLEKTEALAYAKENNLWKEDFYSLGSRSLKGGNEHTLVVDENNRVLYKSNNLFNSKNRISNLLEGVSLHNELFPETKYELEGFTGIDKGEGKVPHVEVILKQDYIPRTEQATPSEIAEHMQSLGFEKISDSSFKNKDVTVSDLHPRNVLKDASGNIYVIDDIIKKNEGKEKGNTPNDGAMGLGADNGRQNTPERNVSVEKEVQSPSELRGGNEKAKVDFAKEQIEKGITNWSGDMGQPRIDLGISWADIRKGESDLKSGKENSVPAKRLIEAIDKAKTEGGYHYKYGTGIENARAKEFVSLEDIQRMSNEEMLTNAEIELINRNAEQLSNEYNDYFNSLSEPERTEIRENHENRTTEERGISEQSSERRESKTDVSNEKKGTISEATKKLAEEVRKLKVSKPDAFQSHTPASLAWDLGVEAVAKTIEATGDVAQAVSDGLDAIKSTEWYKSLKDDKKAEVEAVFENSFNNYKEPEVMAEADGKKYTSLKKAVYDSEREAQGKEVINTTNKKTPKEVRENVEKQIKSGEITETEIRDIASALAGKQDIGTKLTGEEIEYALLHDKVTLQKEARQLEMDLEKAQSEGNQKEIEDIMFKMAENEILANTNYIASKTTGSEASRIMHAKKAGLDEDYSYQAVMDKINQMSEGKDVSPELKGKLKTLTNQITDLQSKLDDYQSKFDNFEKENEKLQKEKADLEEMLSKGSAEEKLERLKKLKDKTDYKKANIEIKKKAKIDEIRAKYKRLSGTLNAGVNPKLLELAPEIGALAKLYVEEGVIKLEEIIGKIMIDLDIPELDERTVRDLFSGYGKSVKLTDNPELVTLSQLKSKARALSGLEDVKELGIPPSKSGLKHREPTDEVKAIRREITEEMRRQGIDPKSAKNPEDLWKTSLESYKKRLTNRIEYLETIKKNEDVERFLREKQRVKLKLDQEARDLKKRQQLLKNQVDDMVKRADFETWSNFRKGLNYANRFTRGVLISSPVTLVKIIGAATWRAAYKPLLAVSTYGATKLAPNASKLEGIHTLPDLAEHLGTYYSELFSKKNAQEFIKTFKNHKTSEDILLGKYHGEDIIPKVEVKGVKTALQASFFWSLKVLDKNGALHGSLKNFVSRPEYEAYKKTILKNLIKEGIDPEAFNQPTLHAVADQMAFQKGLMARFMQDNIPASTQKMLEGYLEGKGRHTEKELLNIVFPIVKIGSNYVTESLEKLPLVGLTMNAKPLFKSIFDKGNMTPQQKSNVLRALSYQGVGLASYMIGMYAYQSISPFYGTNAKKYADKNGKDLPEESEDLGFMNHTFTHSPEAVMMKAGASHMWLWDQYDKENPKEKSMVTFMSQMFQDELANVPAITAQSPYISGSESVLVPLITPGHDVGKAGANFVRGRVPGGDVLKDLAQGKTPFIGKFAHGLDHIIGEKIGLHRETVKPSEIGLYPKGFWNNIAIGIPGWRDDVLNEMYDEKYGIKSKLKDVNEMIDQKMHKGEKDVKKMQFQEEHAKE